MPRLTRLRLNVRTRQSSANSEAHNRSAVYLHWLRPPHKFPSLARGQLEKYGRLAQVARGDSDVELDVGAAIDRTAAFKHRLWNRKYAYKVGLIGGCASKLLEQAKSRCEILVLLRRKSASESKAWQENHHGREFLHARPNA